MSRPRTDSFRLSFEEPPPAQRPCDFPGCTGHGEFRAPKDRNKLYDYHWFCLDHVRDYNSRWDYYRGLSEVEIEQDMRRSMTWDRPTWPMGDWHARERRLRRRAMHDFAHGLDEAGRAQAEPARRRPQTPEEEARAVLAVDEGADFADIKARYRELVKRHHPDANGGDVAAEERLKRINQAYTTLKACYGA